MEKVITQQTNPEVTGENTQPNVKKLYNILSLSLVGVLLFTQIFITIAMLTGIISVSGVTFSATELKKFIVLILSAGMTESMTVKFILVLIFAVIFLAIFVTVVIALIKSFIRFAKFIKLDKDFAERKEQTAAYAKTASKCIGNVILLIVLSLLTNTALTGMGAGVIVLSTISYVCLSALTVYEKHIESALDRKTITEMCLQLAKYLILMMIAFLLAANIPACLENLKISATDYTFVDQNRRAAFLYYRTFRPMFTVIPVLVEISVIVLIARNYILKLGKKDAGKELGKLSIVLIVVSVLFAVTDCIMHGWIYESTAADYARLISENWLAQILISVALIVILKIHFTLTEERAIIDA